MSNAAHTEDTVKTAASLYEEYCLQVGGKAFNGDPLPAWDEFAADPAKSKQAQAWLMLGLKVGGNYRMMTQRLVEALSVLDTLNFCVHTGYDFNADPSGLTAKVSETMERCSKGLAIPKVMATGTVQHDIARTTNVEFPARDEKADAVELLREFERQVDAQFPGVDNQGIRGGLKISIHNAIIALGREPYAVHEQPEPEVHPRVYQDKLLRKELDVVLQKLKVWSQTTPAAVKTEHHFSSRHRSLAITHLEDAIMRLGMDLKEFSEQNPDKAEPTPYPNSYNPQSPAIEPTADNLKL